MMVYLDSSALVKCYGEEAGALATIDLIDGAELVATSVVTRVEVASALARAVRRGILGPDAGHDAFRAFTDEAGALIHVPATEPVLARAQTFVWEYGLRGYEAVQLASAASWQDRVGGAVTLATFDARLATAARQAQLAVWPELPGH